MPSTVYSTRNLDVYKPSFSKPIVKLHLGTDVVVRNPVNPVGNCVKPVGYGVNVSHLSPVYCGRHLFKQGEKFQLRLRSNISFYEKSLTCS